MSVLSHIPNLEIKQNREAHLCAVVSLQAQHPYGLFETLFDILYKTEIMGKSQFFRRLIRTDD